MEGDIFSTLPPLMPDYDPYDIKKTGEIWGNNETEEKQGGFNFGDFLKYGAQAFGSPAANPIAASQQAGNQLAYNLGQSALTAGLASQGLGIKGQLLGAGASLLGEDAQLNRETNAILRGQQLNQTNLSREANAQQLKANLAGRMSPMAIARASAMAYGI